MIATGQATISSNLISGQADTAPAAAHASVGDVYEELPWYPKLEQPREFSVQPENNQTRLMSHLKVWIWTEYA